MMVKRILAPIYTLGPGARVVLWTTGCSKRCNGCISPELQEFYPAGDISINVLAKLLLETRQRTGCTGLTVSGGDPLEQAEELYLLLRTVHDAFQDILLYTGFLYEEILAGKCGTAAYNAVQLADVVVDGPYCAEKNDGESPLRGSINQNICYVCERNRTAYEQYLKKGRAIQNVVYQQEIISVGIPNKAL